MALEILYGKEIIQNNRLLSEKMKQSIDNQENVLYIVPEQFSFGAEKALLDTLGETYSHLTETVNFKRLATIVNKKYQPNQLDYIDEEIKNLILYQILRKNSEQLITVKNRKQSPDSVAIFKSILSECKGYLIDHAILDEMKAKLEEGSFLHQKICDLDFILSEYQKAISEKFRDFEDSFQTLAGYIESENLYQGYSVYIDHFNQFSPAEYLVISALLKNAKNVTVTLLLDDLLPKSPGELFFPTYKTYSQLCKIAKKQHQNVIATEVDTKADSFYVDLFDSCPNNPPKTPYSLTMAKNTRDEVRFVADTVLRLVADGVSFSDISVLTGDLSVYENEIEEVFLEAGIPCFLDEKTPLTENPVAKIFLNLFAMVVSDYKKDNVLAYLKSLCSIYDVHEEVCIFEELCHRFHIQKQDLYNPEKWSQKCSFLKEQKNFFAFQLPKVETIYNRFLKPVFTYFHKTNANYRQAFVLYAGEIHLEEAVKRYLEQAEATLRQETVTAYNTILKAIKNIDTLFADEKITLMDYHMVLKQSLELYESGDVPDTLDTVTVSDTERGRLLSCPYVFILGMNENITPKANSNHSYLSDVERETILDLTGIELPTSLFQNCDSNLALYRSFLIAEKHLYLSCNQAESEQAKRMPCYLWNRLKNFQSVTEFSAPYVNISEYSEKALMSYKNPYKQKLSPKKIPDDFFKNSNKEKLLATWNQIDLMQKDGYYTTDKKISKKLMESKYQKQLGTSVSRLETYQKCRYMYFLNYMLNVQEREDVSYDMRRTGSIVHNLFDMFSKQLKKDGLSWDSLSDDYIEEKAQELVPREIMRTYPDLSLFNPRTKYLIQKIKRLLKRAIAFIREHFQEGDFLPVGYEVSIGDDIPPLTIQLEDGSVMQLYGKIDRFDAADLGDRLYVRIIDYKSSEKKFDFAFIKEGIQLQLLTYLRAVIKNGGEYLDFAGEILPGAAFYTSFNDELISFKERPGSDESEKELRKKFTMKGFVLNDDSLIRAIDRHLGEEISYQSAITDIKVNKDGQYNLKNFLFLEEFNRLLNDCENTLKSIGETMMSGDIAVKPYRYGPKTACDYCPYGGICMFDGKMHPYHYIEKLSKEDYFKPQSKEKAGAEDGN